MRSVATSDKERKDKAAQPALLLRLNLEKPDAHGRCPHGTDHGRVDGDRTSLERRPDQAAKLETLRNIAGMYKEAQDREGAEEDEVLAWEAIARERVAAQNAHDERADDRDE